MAFEPAGVVAAAAYILLLTLPGLALLSLLVPRLRDPVMAAGLSAGLGLAVYPLLFLWAHVAGVRLGPGAVVALALASGIVVAIQAARRIRRGPTGSDGAGATAPEPRAVSATELAPWLAACVVFLVVLASRGWAVHDVSVPLWGDSLHHTMIVRLLATGGGLVDSWEPLAPLSSFTYHFGLHSGVASLVWLTGLPEHRALLVAGQVLSALQVLTAYALVAGLTRRPWAGVGAALAVGGLSPMPAYYVNWGRYTQLAGQVLLPTAALLAVWAASGRSGLAAGDAESETVGSEPPVGCAGDAESETVGSEPPVGCAGDADLDTVGYEPPGGSAGDTSGGHGPASVGPIPGPEPRVAARRGLRLGAGAAIAVGGLALTHYLVALVFGLFALAWLVVSAGDLNRSGLRRRVSALVRLAAVAVAAMLLTLPWLARLSDSIIGRAAAEMVTGGLKDADVYGVVSPQSVWSEYSLLVGAGLIAVVAVAAIWGVARRERTVWLGLAWAGLLLVAAYPGALGLPITPPLKDFTVAIGLYLPASLVVGGAFGDVMGVVEAAKPAASWAALAAVACLAVVLAWKDRSPVIDEHVLVTPADEQAMTWVRDETPPDSVFLVSCLKAFGGTVCAGDDAGWWIPLLADRRTTVPPVTYGVETAAEPGYVQSVNLLADLWHADLYAPETIAAMDEAGVTHAFLGVTAEELDRALLAASPMWELVYDRAGVQVFEREGLGDGAGAGLDNGPDDGTDDGPDDGPDDGTGDGPDNGPDDGTGDRSGGAP